MYGRLQNMSNSLDSFLTRIGDVTIERVTPRGSPGSSDQGVEHGDIPADAAINDLASQTANDDSSNVSSEDSADVEREKKNENSQPDDIEEIRSEGSGDDMDLDETIDTQIGVRMESERQHSESSSPEDDGEHVNILDTLPLEGAYPYEMIFLKNILLFKIILKILHRRTDRRARSNRS